MPAGFWLLDVMFCYEWVEVVLCCSRSDGATHGDALPSHGWGLSAFSKPWCDGKSQAGGDQTQFLSLKQMFLEVNFFPQAFPVIPAMLLVYFRCKPWAPALLCWAAEYSSTPDRRGGTGRSWMGSAEWGDLGASKGSTSCFSAEKFIAWALCAYGKELCPWHRMFLFTICMYVFIYLFIAFTPVESNIVTLTAFFLSGQSSKEIGGNTAPLSFLLIWFIIPLFPPSCLRALCADPKGQVAMTETGVTDQGVSWIVPPFYEEEIYFIFLRCQGMSLNYKW